MNNSERLNIARRVLQTMLFKRKFPLVLMWGLTYRCNLSCLYCGCREEKVEELDTENVCSIIDKASKLGTKFITFGGGEPLLREDLGEIIDYCKGKHIRVLINSNGTLIKKDFYKIKNVDEIQISLDGPPHINDAIRGKSVHDKVIEALGICKDNNINVMLNATISKQNISYIPYLLKIAQEHKVEVYFQPANQNLSHNSRRDINFLYGPEEDDYKSVINFLIKQKLDGNALIKNSIPGLKYIYHWPKPHNIKCLMSLLTCTIEPNGKIFLCDCFPDYQKYLKILDEDFEKSFKNILLPHACNECWTGSLVDVNLATSFQFDNMLNLWDRFINMTRK